MKDRDLLRLWATLRPLPRRMQILRRPIRLQTRMAVRSASCPKTRWQASVFYVMTSHVPRGSCPVIMMLSASNAFCKSSAVKQPVVSGPVRCVVGTFTKLFRTVRLPRRLDRRLRALQRLPHRRPQGPRRPSISELHRMDASGTDLTGLSAHMISWKPLDPT